MAQDATKNLPNLTSNDSLLDQVQSAAGRETDQNASFLAQVTRNPFFTAVRTCVLVLAGLRCITDHPNLRASVLPS